MRPSFRPLLSLTLLALLLAGCAGGPAPVTDPADSLSGPVVGPRWNLLLVGTSDRLDLPTTPWFEVAPDGRVSGHDGCNRFTGSVELGPNNRIEFGELAATRMACPHMDQSGQVTAMLDTAYRYLIDHDRLVFFGPDQRVLGGFRRDD
ncbi:META domain-containing protein [Halomonas sp. M4R1S46]|uniref:META domain-containing protein n=1 Tax=Halomonas sp. M4R1S46 TaxID=2982692 RepID=UPI0021E39973|nr:META domain-containing protein [Halomonas sp. M4R1S46]UYG07362.1 META domain-containing protein [Halomonas sp. M4R1S46]